jgi:translocation and assembly module TamB
LEIVDGRLLLQGQSSPQPWPIEGMNLNLTLIPAAENTAGVPILHGQQARLMNQVELTPEMCNDLLKFITPPLFQATRTSGKVSLELDEFNWPLGKPDAAQLTGRLTLHSVEVVPGPVMQLLNSLLQNRNAPLALQIAKDDEVSFHMHDGRVYHENLTFRLAALQVQMLIHSHGSVGLDESLDWFIEFQFPGLDGVDLAGHPFMKLLSQKPTLHIIGTLSQPKLSPEGLALQALQTGIDMLRQPAGQGREQPQQGPAANPGGLNNPTSPPPAKP